MLDEREIDARVTSTPHGDALRAQGVSVIYISHKMEEIFKIADRISVMRDGSLETRLVEDRGHNQRAERRFGGDRSLGLGPQAGPDGIDPVEPGCEVACFHDGAP